MLALSVAIILCPALAPPPSIADYFPLTKGFSWHYEEYAEKRIVASTDDKCEANRRTP